MMAKNARTFFKELGRNFMTPDRLRCSQFRRDGQVHYVEIAEGTDFDGNEIFGVTVYRDNGKYREELSKLFYDREKAFEWYDNVHRVEV